MTREALIQKYHQQTLTPDEEAQLEAMIASGEIELEALSDLHDLGEQLQWLAADVHSPDMSHQFHQWLETEATQAKASLKNNTNPIVRWLSSPMTAAAMLVLGLLTGISLTQKGGTDAGGGPELVAELTRLRTDLMMTLLKEDSSTERLKAVHLTSEITEVTQPITEALLKTLREDSNSNVRLAALDALYPFAERPQVRAGLIKSISFQEDPLVLIAMSELMVDLQEQQSVGELEQVLKRENTPPEVKERIQSSLDILL
jgi:hypothetical protein